MTDFTYPSEVFPAPPAVRVHTPDGWEPIASPGAVIAVRAEVEEGVFAPNVIVTVHRYQADFTLEAALEAIRSELAEFAESRVEEPFAASFGEDQYVVVNTALRHPEFGMMVQVHAYTSFLYGELKDVVHVVGTCSGERLTQDYPVLQQVMESTRVQLAVPAAPA